LNDQIKLFEATQKSTKSSKIFTFENLGYTVDTSGWVVLIAYNLQSISVTLPKGLVYETSQDLLLLFYA